VITFSALGQLGRLGNQLWQYAAMRSLGLRTGDVPLLPATMNETVWHGQRCALKEAFEVPLDFTSHAAPQQFSDSDPQEFSKAFLELTGGVNLHGFFQNPRYFEGYEDIIKSDLKFRPWLDQQAEAEIERIREKHPGKHLVSVHIRRGDLVEKVQGSNFFGDAGFLEEDSKFYLYLEKAFVHFDSEDTVYLVFTGGSRENQYNADLKWCRENIDDDMFEIKHVHYVEQNDSLLDFALMSKCDSNILCHSTTFGWWAGFLNPNPMKLVIAPRFYYVDYPDREVDGFYPKEFTLI